MSKTSFKLEIFEKSVSYKFVHSREPIEKLSTFQRWLIDGKLQWQIIRPKVNAGEGVDEEVIVKDVVVREVVVKKVVAGEEIVEVNSISTV